MHNLAHYHYFFNILTTVSHMSLRWRDRNELPSYRHCTLEQPGHGNGHMALYQQSDSSTLNMTAG